MLFCVLPDSNNILIVVDGGDDSRLHLVNIVAHLHAVAIELNALRE